MERRSRNFLRALVGVFAIATVVALVLTIYALNARNQATQQGQIAQSEANQRATAEVIALEEREEALNQADARATQQAIAEAEAEARTVAEEQAVEERDRAVIAEQDALVQVSIGLASQSKLELEGAAPERSVLLALEAMEDYPYTWQAERALGQAVLNSQLKLILNHDGKVNTAQWSADGTKILTGGVDETVRVWDTLTGDELLRITEGNPTVASWSPNEEYILALKSPSGDRFLTYDENGTVKIWDAESGGALLTLSSDHSGKYGDARWSPSGDLILSASPQDNMIFLWQSKTGDLLYTITGDFETEEVYLGDWSPTGDRFTIVGDGGAKVYDTATGRQLLYLPTPGFVYRVKWSPDGLRILTTVTEGGSGFATLWDAESGQELSNIPDLNMAFGSDWSTSGKLAAIGTGGFSVHVWDINKDQEVHKLVGAPPFIWHVAFSPGGERILATGEDNTVKIYDLTSTLLTIPVPPGWAGGYWSRDGEQIAYAFTDGTVKIWNSVSGDEAVGSSC
jgi:WD40 repeat protein